MLLRICVRMAKREAVAFQVSAVAKPLSINLLSQEAHLLEKATLH